MMLSLNLHCLFLFYIRYHFNIPVPPELVNSYSILAGKPTVNADMASGSIHGPISANANVIINQNFDVPSQIWSKKEIVHPHTHTPHMWNLSFKLYAVIYP